ncbi:type II secretion system F family protein [Aeromicrobium camelliae]|uniref:Type II secretion system F family protein n=1 Tax=Aeromicrobium camelliae TaxID=1538144 RepID=A0A3N6XZX6_9ACTN|nr:type II secretion system F family protein [Aeromicrobium camelliae]RQN03274.1 type II secretion system F family protein [Aeromicrobium camelliae]
MLPLLFGLASVAVAIMFVAGYRAARADTLAGLDVADIALLRDKAQKKQRLGPLDRIARRYAPVLESLLGAKRIEALRLRIEMAGRPNGMTVTTFLELVVKYAILLGTASLALLSLGQPLSAVAVLAGIYLFPMSRLSGHLKNRRDQIDTDLPDMLDILAVTVGAGIGFRSALERVASRFEGPLHDEIMQTLRELDVGVPRRRAFTNLRDRCQSEAMNSFVSAFLQAEELGAPLAESLSHIARDSRRDASQRARRRAAQMVPRVTLVVSIVMVPPTVAVIAVGLYLGSGIDLGSVFSGG